jgi:hypothetical protein
MSKTKSGSLKRSAPLPKLDDFAPKTSFLPLFQHAYNASTNEIGLTGHLWPNFDKICYTLSKMAAAVILKFNETL